jgi:hypothetical protein
MTIQEDKIERRKASERARQEHLRRKAGMPTREEWKAANAARRSYVERLAIEHGASIRVIYRRIEAGKIPTFEAAQGGDNV